MKTFARNKNAPSRYWLLYSECLIFSIISIVYKVENLNGRGGCIFPRFVHACVRSNYRNSKKLYIFECLWLVVLSEGYTIDEDGSDVTRRYRSRRVCIGIVPFLFSLYISIVYDFVLSFVSTLL